MGKVWVSGVILGSFYMCDVGERWGMPGKASPASSLPPGNNLYVFNCGNRPCRWLVKLEQFKVYPIQEWRAWSTVVVIRYLSLLMLSLRLVMWIIVHCMYWIWKRENVYNTLYLGKIKRYQQGFIIWGMGVKGDTLKHPPSSPGNKATKS